MTAEDIQALSPDASNFARGKKLASKSKWTLMSRKEEIIWGLCKGSGKNPYKVQIDLTEPAYKCSCPSRKFPCKHAIALLLLHATESHSFIEEETPDWVNEWLEKRSKTTTKKTEKKPLTEADLLKSEKAKAKTAAKRAQQMSAGIAELKDWLNDVIRMGIAELQKQDYAYFDEKGSRFHDAKLPVLGNVVKELYSTLKRPNWQIQSLETLSWLYTVANGYNNKANLSHNLQADLYTVVGVPIRTKNLIEEGKSINDNWLVLGKHKETAPLDTNLVMQRTWLLGEKTKQFALLLDSSYQKSPFKYYFSPNSVFNGELVYFPGSFPLRATLKNNNGKPNEDQPERVGEIKTAPDFSAFLKEYTQVLSKNPFILQYPFLVQNLYFNSKMDVFDKHKRQIPLNHSFKNNYDLLALSGGFPITLFGEWNGQQLLPLCAISDGKILVI